jgi:hypothetical protein
MSKPLEDMNVEELLGELAKTQSGGDQLIVVAAPATVDVSAVEALGYTVEVNDGDEGAPYWIRGPRGAEYFLMRNLQNPHHLFAVNGRGFTKTAKPGGYEWFSDEDGRLRPMR